MLVFTYKILITKQSGEVYEFIDTNPIKSRFFSECDITSTWKSISDVATVKFANVGKQLENEFKIGDKIEIWLGYDSKLVKEFTGFITSISPNFPYTVTCKDSSYNADKTKVENKSYSSTTLKEVIEYVAGDKIQIANISTIPSVTLSPFFIKDLTISQALNKLKEDYGFVTYFRDGKLFAGLVYSEVLNKVNKYNFQENIKKDGLDLTYRTLDSFDIKVKCISIQRDNTKLEAESGAKDGEIRTFYYQNITNLNILQGIADEKAKILVYEGYEGSFNVFGTDSILHSQIVEITDANYPQRNGSYFVDEVKKTVSNNGGYNVKITLGQKAS